MGNKKIKPTDDFYSYLPKRLQESTKLSVSEKNVLATLCFERIEHRDYAAEHEGWFYCSQQDLIEGTMFSKAQLNRKLLDIEIKGIIQRKSGTNHRCTHYKLHPKIEELLPKIESEFHNETLLESHYDANDANETLLGSHNDGNETLAIKTQEKTPNETLDKIRLDKISKEKDLNRSFSQTTNLISNSSKKQTNTNSIDFKTLETETTQFCNTWKLRLVKCKNVEEFVKTREELKQELTNIQTKLQELTETESSIMYKLIRSIVEEVRWKEKDFRVEKLELF